MSDGVMLRKTSRYLAPVQAALVIIAGLATAHAADVSPFDELNAVAEIPITGEYAMNIVQKGDGNEGHITLIQGAQNMSALEQVGGNNIAVIIQDGDFNIATQYQQGTGNQAQISQQGAWNKVVQQQFGVGNYLSATQTGNNNYLNQTQNGTGLRGEITQTGGMILTIVQNN